MSTLTHIGRSGPAANPDPTRGGARPIDLVWLTWRQHRAVITAGLTLAAALTGALLYLAARIATINQQCGNTACPGGSTQAASLAGPYGLSHISQYLTLLVVFLPLLVGVFLGVPVLAREHEQRTLLLAWSQDITPQRWVWTRVALLGTLTTAVVAAVAVAAGHLADVTAVATGKSLFQGAAFLVTGMVPLAQSLAWFAVGVALGAAYRRTLPAIFTALVGYIVVYFLVEWTYPTFLTPLTVLVPVTGNNGPGRLPQLDANALIANVATLYDASGHPLSQADMQSMCPTASGPGPGTGITGNQCLVQHHLQTLLNYQPSSRIGEFHLILIGGYVGLGVIAAAALWWLIRHTNLSAG